MDTVRKFIGTALFGNGVDFTIALWRSFLPKKGKILDLGAGTCLYTKALLDDGYDMTPVDVRNRSYFTHIVSKTYNGKKLPFKNDAFSACILIAVLHHTPDPEVVLKEAARTSKRIIVYEDAITNPIQRWYTYVIDSLLNKEFIGHPHTNKTDAQWRRLFKKLHLKIVKVTHGKSWLFLDNPTYFLQK